MLIESHMMCIRASGLVQSDNLTHFENCGFVSLHSTNSKVALHSLLAPSITGNEL